jgi:small-conductance mechanosensitive channel
MVFIVSVVCSWMGYTLLAVQVLIWWIMQLTCILTITCVSQYIKRYGERRNFAEAPVTRTWAYDLFYQVILPSLSVGSVMLSIWWAADVFNLSDLCWRAFKYHFIDQDNFQLSIIKLTMVICLWFLFSYLSKTLLRLLRLAFQMRDPDSAESRTVMSKNVIQIIIWGTWVLMSLTILHISISWLLYITGGLSAGIGFASKNIIENIFYGASLMAGRLKVGDWIDVDGTVGKVQQISYTSTIVESLAGEIITFQNSQLFDKNYKNLTRNHGYVVVPVMFGVAYGTNLQRVQSLVDDAVNALDNPWVDQSKQAHAIVVNMNDSSVDFRIVVWAEVAKRAAVMSEVLTCIYDTLNDHGIEIPFPQRDVHIIQG